MTWTHRGAKVSAALHQNTGKALAMPRNRNLLFVIADSERARFMRPADHKTLRNDATLEAISVHKRGSELGSDHPGAAYHNGSSAHHAVAPRHDLHVLEKAKFGRAIAQRLNAAASANSFDELVIVAPPHTLVEVRQRLDAATDARIVGTLAKDLAKTPDEELWPHLQWWIRPRRRAKFVASHQTRG
jgi:protein required for attachment to host cells